MDLFDKREASPMLIAQQMDAFDNPGWLYELKLEWIPMSGLYRLRYGGSS